LSQGGAWTHNLYPGRLGNRSDPRQTPWLKPHSTQIARSSGIDAGDDQFYNNLFVGAGKDESLVVENTNPVRAYYFSYGLRCYEQRPRLPEAAGNVYHYGAEPCKNETEKTMCADDMNITIVEDGENVYLELTLAPEDVQAGTRLVDTELLGKAEVTQQTFTQPDGSDLRIDTDYFRQPRDAGNPMPGPFVIRRPGRQHLQVWPTKS